MVALELFDLVYVMSVIALATLLEQGVRTSQKTPKARIISDFAVHDREAGRR